MGEERSRGNRKGKGRNKKGDRRDEERKRKEGSREEGRKDTIVLVSSRQYLTKK